MEYVRDIQYFSNFGLIISIISHSNLVFVIKIVIKLIIYGLSTHFISHFIRLTGIVYHYG